MTVRSGKVRMDNRARVVESVESGLAGVGVDSTVVFHLLSAEHGLKAEQIPDRPGLFADSLVEIFGDGVKPVVLSILRELLICSYRGVEFSPLAASLTELLGTHEASQISPSRIALERELAEEEGRSRLGQVKTVRRAPGQENRRDRENDSSAIF